MVCRGPLVLLIKKKAEGGGHALPPPEEGGGIHDSAGELGAQEGQPDDACAGQRAGGGDAGGGGARGAQDEVVGGAVPDGAARERVGERVGADEHREHVAQLRETDDCAFAAVARVDGGDDGGARHATLIPVRSGSSGSSGSSNSCGSSGRSGSSGGCAGRSNSIEHVAQHDARVVELLGERQARAQRFVALVPRPGQRLDVGVADRVRGVQRVARGNGR